MSLPIPVSLESMNALLVDRIPDGPEWQYEPKWDGFRCLAFRDGDRVVLQSKSGQPLARYFPEIVAGLLALKATKFVLDGEIVIQQGGELSFDALLQRIHPAASRIKKLSTETPGTLLVFDLLADDRGRSLLDKPLKERRAALETFARKYFPRNTMILLSPATTNRKTVDQWFSGVGGAGGTLDGVIAKRLDMPYQAGNRLGMVKVKQLRSADCVVGGFRYASKGGDKSVGSLLLGLYDGKGLLNHMGFCSSFTASERKALVAKLKPLIKPPGFTGQAPGGPSRWSTERSTEWQPLDPKLVVEVRYDHFTGGRFRHGTTLLRWRPDKSPKQCTMAQVERESNVSLKKLIAPKKKRSTRSGVKALVGV